MAKIANPTDIRAFTMIVGFANDLAQVFKDKSLSDYCKIINSLKPIDVESIQNLVSGYRTFISTYREPFLKSDKDLKTLHAGIKIPTKPNGRIALDLQHFCFKADDETLPVIRQHLISIGNILFPQDDVLSSAIKEFKNKPVNIDTDTDEYKYVLAAAVKIKKAWSDTDGKLPSAKIDAIMATRVVQDFLDKAAKGTFDKDKIFPAIHAALQKQGFDLSSMLMNMPISLPGM
jgi:hypothetical protein